MKIASMKEYHEMFCPNCGTVYLKDRPQKRGILICVFCLNVWDKGVDHSLINIGRTIKVRESD